MEWTKCKVVFFVLLAIPQTQRRDFGQLVEHERHKTTLQDNMYIQLTKNGQDDVLMHLLHSSLVQHH